MTIKLIVQAPDFLLIQASDTLLRTEVDIVKRQVFAHIQLHGRVHVMIQIHDGFKDFQAFVNWDDIEEDAVIQKNIIRLAIVGDLRWRDKAMLFFLNAASPFQIEYFDTIQEEFARYWLLS